MFERFYKHTSYFLVSFHLILILEGGNMRVVVALLVLVAVALLLSMIEPKSKRRR
jgi:hypothetical protein